MDEPKKKQEPLPPIGEEMKIARDILWNPRMEPSKTPLSDVAMPTDRKPSSKRIKRSLPAIMGLAAEMRDAIGDCPAARAYEEKLLQEGGFAVRPKDTGELDRLLDGNE